MKNTLTTIALAALFAIAQQAQAVTMNLSYGYLFENDGTTQLAQGSTVLVLADTAGDGFGDLTLADSWNGGQSDNLVLARFAYGSEVDTGVGQFAVNFDLGTPAALTSGDDLMLVWYDTAYNISATGAGAGVYYGTFRSENLLDSSDFSWNVPASNGDSGALNALTSSSGYGSNPDSAFTASFQTIPEPSSTLLVLSGLGMLAFFRRRKH